MPTERESFSLRHLQAELERLDALVRREVRRWQLADQDPTDNFRGLYLSDEQVEALLARPFATSWGQTVKLPIEEAEAFERALACATQKAQVVTEEAYQHGQQVRLKHLASVFELNRFELDALLICLAPSLDRRYERLYGYLQDDITCTEPTLNLVLDLLCDPGPERLKMLSRFSKSSPLLKHHLIRFEKIPEGKETEPLLRRTLHIDPAIVGWLLGDYHPCSDLLPHARLLSLEESEEDRLVTAKIRHDLDHLLTISDQAPIIALSGPDEVIQEAAARLVAREFPKRLLVRVDLASALADEQSAHHIVSLALRDARLLDAMPYLTGWDACLADKAPPADLIAAICAFPHSLIIASKSAWQARGIDRDRTLFRIKCPLPSPRQRETLWLHFLEKVSNETQSVRNSDVTDLAGQFTLTTGQIRDAVATARDLAAQRGGAIRRADLFAGARAHSNPRLASLAHKITPRYDWHDIVLPDDQMSLLHEIVVTVRGRPKVLGDWGVGERLATSAGVTMLFAGPPGTGKTMAAEVIAAELGLDLYKIDLSTVVSKYIGETEKNLERIFSEARNSNAILFFDEADALFGKRSGVEDAHDRYANIEISYLLQRMETYDGVTILATNLRANLDEAFTRRLQFAVDFPFPEKEERLRIWRTLFPPNVPRAPDLDLALLARRFKLAGGSIRNIIVNAAFLAASEESAVTMEHLIHSTRREFQKMGRLMDEADLALD